MSSLKVVLYVSIDLVKPRIMFMQTLARVVETAERHFKAAGRRSGLPLPTGVIEDRDHFRVWPKVHRIYCKIACVNIYCISCSASDTGVCEHDKFRTAAAFASGSRCSDTPTAVHARNMSVDLAAEDGREGMHAV